MKTILMASELGSGLGHLMRLRPVAAACLEAGHRVVLTSRRRGSAEAAFGDLLSRHANLKLLPSPPLGAARHRDEVPPSHSLADVLADLGFADAKSLLPRAARWDHLLKRIRPDLVLAAFAPTLTLVARGRVPVVTVGSGYTIPPATQPLPPIRPWDKELPVGSRRAERDILETCNRLAEANRLPPVNQVAELFRGTISFPCTLPLLDPYARHRKERLWIPMHLRPRKNGPDGGAADRRAAFVYLPGNHPFLNALLEMLVAQDWQVSAYIDGNRARRQIPEAVRMLPDRPNLADILPGQSLVVHHGGQGTAHAALFAGVPQLLFPSWLEDHVTCHILTRLGVGAAFSASEPLSPAMLEDGLSLLQSEGVIAAAAGGAAKLSPLPSGETTVQAIIEVSARLLDDPHQGRDVAACLPL